jgi:2-amino-4-hydroxy-6-hydroxymethyldihydropteridine diphosphokinase
MNHNSLISLGANQQDPKRQLHLAKIAIQALPHTYLRACSPIMMTQALGHVRQQDYFNQLILVSTMFNPISLLNHLQAIEKKLGRVRRQPWGPRIIDIDILSYDELKLNHPRLQLPHPQILTRPFIQELIEKLRQFSN